MARSKSRFEPTLHQVFIVCLVGLSVHFAGLGWILFSGVLGHLDSTHTRVLLIAAFIVAFVAIVAWLTLHTVHRELGRIVEDAERMRQFNFEAAPAGERFIIADFRDVRDSLEQGKMAIRAMRKYVPVTLMRQLYHEQKEVKLGAEPLEISMLFSDIRDFTTVSENLSGSELARALGLYLDAMARSIDAHQGTIDKYIGDSVMAFWNAPLPIENDARRACLAALHSVRACDQLFSSPEWGGLPRWATRYGIHRDRVMVGNFGAPDRLNYTAMGDGVNTASRLEGLNKAYGTWIMVSETIRDAVADEFVFRKLDVVAVKGKTKPTAVFELLGETATTTKPEHAHVYEKAFDSYLAGDFTKAVDLLRPQRDHDAPSSTLFQRCIDFQKVPPPANWNGVFVSHTK